MNPEDLTLIQVWVEVNQKALEFSVGDRTFQICGIRGALGLYERIFHGTSHPTRQVVSTEEMLGALCRASGELELYRGPKGSGKKFATPTDALKAAKEWQTQ